MTKFNYTPLSTGGYWIRVLTLLPGRFEDDIKILLSDGQLSPTDSSFPDDREGGSEESPPAGYVNRHYTALSYVWGTTDNPGQVFVTTAHSHGSLSVTRNLEEALRYLRHADEERLLWVDAICINQEDLEERSSQVSLMSRLYTDARDVTIWLGMDRDDSDFALEFLNCWGMAVDVDWLSSTVHVLDGAWTVKPDNVSGEIFTAVQESMKRQRLNGRQSWALHHLMNREWFERLWVRQEALTQTPTRIRCGNVEFGTSAIMRAIFHMQNRNTWFDLPGVETLRFLERRKLIYDLSVTTAETRPLERLRYDLQGLSWGLPVDAIYASLNLLTTQERALGIVPDYSLSTAAVFIDTATRVMKSTHVLTLLHTCELGSKFTPDLPSWVPDWATQIKVDIMDIHWSASAFVAAQGSFEPGNILRVAAIRKATVSTVHKLTSNLQSRDMLYSKVIGHMWKLLRSVDLSKTYVGGRDLCDAYAKTFVCEYCMERYESTIHRPKLDEMRQFMHKLQSTPSLEAAHELLRKDHEIGHMSPYLAAAFSLFKGRSFVMAEEGYIGLVPEDTQPGDALYVILGCRMPMVLRNVRDDAEKWQVVGSCYVAGLMTGESIYGNLPDYLAPTQRTIQTNTHLLTLKDERTGEYENDSCKIMESFGISVDEVFQNPHRLEISRETLMAKGINVTMIDIV